MTLQQISEVLNDSIVPAIMGDDYTVNPNLDNLVDFGTKISAMTADQFKSYFNEFAACVAKTVADKREYNPDDLPLYVDAQEYGGLVQHIKSDFTEIRNSSLYSLVDGQYYNDVNKYFGTAFDNKVYEKDNTFQIAKSIPNSMYKKAFCTADGVREIVALIEVWITNSEHRALSALEHNLMSGLGLKGTKINLVTMYNTMVDDAKVANATITGTQGETEIELEKSEMVTVTSDNCIYNTFFMRWAFETISNVIAAAKYANKKYNDGTVSTWLNTDDAKMVFNSIFANRAKALNIALPSGVAIYDTPFWNAQTDNVIPTIANTASIIYENVSEIEGEPTAENASIDNVVGIYFDKYAAGYTITPITPRTSYNADGDFYNVFRDYNRRYWVDTRNTAIVFTLN